MKYNYLIVTTANVLDYIDSEVNTKDFTDDHGDIDRDALIEYLNDELWTCDSVTGNASGSYTFSRLQAREYVIGNMDLLNEAIETFCVDAETVADKFLSENWEYFDVTIRCYVLSEAIENAVDEFLLSVEIPQFQEVTPMILLIILIILAAAK